MKTRTISGAIILLVLLIAMILGTNIFAILMLFCAILAFRELYNLKFKEKTLEIVKFISYLSLILLVLNQTFFNLNYLIVIVIPLLALIIPVVGYNNSKKYNINDALIVMGIIYFLGLAFGTIVYVRSIDIYKCLYIFIIAFITDTYAYIGGNLIGKHKLTSISPKKTIEGTIVGTFMGTLVGSLYYYTVVGNNILLVILLSLSLTVLSEIGDLVFSSIKRYYDVKDYSNTIPGHGGILDRFDSVIFVALGLTIVLSIM